MTPPDAAAARLDRRSPFDMPPDPVFILSPPLSLASVVAAMLGQHPQLSSLPETHLFVAETVREWWEICTTSSFNMAHGLLRAVAQLYCGGQTDDTILLARGWLRRRVTFPTGYIAELLARKVGPRILIEKSPSVIFHLSSMQRAYRMFPQAKFIHLLQHPRGHGEAVIAAVKTALKYGPVPQWLRQLANFSAVTADECSQERSEIDPQQAWCALNTNICEFVDALPQSQQLRVRGEDILAAPDAALRSIIDWLGLESDDTVTDAMKHPERSPYACFGPVGARYGDDAHFLANPVLPPPLPEPLRLDGPLSWREDGEGFSAETKRLACEFGYQ
jgi:hypothetical protein